MLVPFLLAVCGATLGAAFALLSLAFARAPGWHSLRWFAVVAGTAAIFCGCFSVQLATRQDWLVEVLARIQLTLAAVHTAAWVPYSGVGPRRLARGLQAVALSIGALALVPGALVGRVILRHPVWAHWDYVNVQPSSLGVTSFAVLFAVLAFPFRQYWTQWRAGDAGDSGAGAHALALGGLALTGIVEAMDSAWLQALPRLTAVGLVGAIVAVGSSLARRFVKSARAYQALSEELDATVELRTEELSRAQEKNLQLESLAALGSLSAAVAHEVNNPAAAASANIRYLIDAVAGGAPPDDLVEDLRDTSESIDRVARVVKQLTFAGDRAARGTQPAPVQIADAVRWASADAHPDVPAGIRVSVVVADGLYAQTEGGTLRQVVTALVISASDAMQAVKCHGTICVQAHREDDEVVLRVADPCPAPDPAQLARRLDAFLSPRPRHVARGVGLAVSVALLRIFGGTLTLERGGVDGSTVRISLPAAEPPKALARPGVASSLLPASLARVLLVDDDVLVRIGLRRLLGRDYSIVEAGTVDEVLSLLREEPDTIDAIVCDLVMPDGGARRLLGELVRAAPDLVASTLLMTGGAVDDETQALLDEHAERVLRKPIDVQRVRAMIQQVRRRPAQSGA